MSATAPNAADSGVSRSPVLLAHGTFSNHRTCRGLARYLATLGHDCWLIDYEGHGFSDVVQPPADFETLFLTGTEVALLYLSDLTARPVHWIGHSGGGLAALMALARRPEIADRFRSLVMLGSQASNAAPRLSSRMTLLLFKHMTSLLGYVPGKRLGLGPEDEAAAVMLQWYQWNLEATWQGEDGFDYDKALKQEAALAALPIFTLAGSGDKLIAPADACRRLHDLLPADDKYWMECGVQAGFSEDYSHARLISSRSSAQEIWPKIGDWLNAVDSGL